MGVLADFQIAALCRSGMITPFDEELINPASLDVRLGETVLIEAEACGLKDLNLHGFTKEKPFYLNPDEFVLAHTLETFNIPDHLAAQFALKSSVARAGLEHLLAGFIDPGFNNSVLTLELKNARRMERFPLWPGMRIGQIVFNTMDQIPLASYKETGRYNGDASVAACKGLL